MLVSTSAATRIARSRQCQHRIPQHRVAPARQQRVPITTRRLNADTLVVEAVTVCYVTVIEVVPSIIGEITAAEARLEGYKSRAAFLAEWQDETLPVWVLSLDVDHAAVPRYLSLGIVAGRQGDYTNNAARSLDPEAGEAVDVEDLAAYAREARLRHETRIHGEREAWKKLTVSEQVELLKAEAHARHVDIRDQLRQIKRYPDRSDIVNRQLTRIREKLGHIAA
jgi:hypothetical protein